MQDKDIYNRLYHILEDESEQYRHSVSLLEQKKTALVHRDMNTLHSVDQALLTLVHRVRQLEKARTGLIQELCSEMPRLELLIQTMPPEESSRFTLIRQRLLRYMNDAGALNKENKSLLDLSIHWIQETVAILAAALNPSASSYGARSARKPNGDMPPSSTISRAV